MKIITKLIEILFITKMNNKLLELVMIVKDSGEDIIPMLKAAKPHIDHWTILDTGSSDDTMKIITTELSDVPGKLIDGVKEYGAENAFVDFSTARNRVLTAAGNTCTFVIMLDDTYVLQDGKKLRKKLRKAKKQSYSGYNITIVDEMQSYQSFRIFKTSDNVRYRYKIHEIAVAPEGTNFRNTTLCTVFDQSSPYMQRRSQARLLKDVELMNEELSKNPQDRRIRLHLARTLATSVLHDDESKKTMCKEQLQILIADDIRDSWDYEARMLRVTLDMDASNCSPELLNDLKLIHEHYPHSEEVCYMIAVHYRSREFKRKAFEWIVKAADIEPKLGEEFCRNSVNVRVLRYEIPYLFADLAIQTHHLDAAEKTLKKFAPINNDTRLINMVYAISNIPQPPGKTLNGPIVVIHATNSVKGWSHDNLKGVGASRGSGSEVMAINLAEALARRRYRVFIFGDFKGTHNDQEYNTECVHKGVQYMDHSQYFDFLLEFQVDALIVSRDVSNLVYLNNVKKAYLWVHDVLPNNSVIKGMTIQYHQTTFKKVLCLCDWHKQQVQKRLGIPDGRMAVTRNAILPHRFARRPRKIPHRYIYTSSADRGLDNLLNLIPHVKSKFPETTLEIFTSISNTAKGDAQALLAKINSLDYVTLHSRVSQAELAHELLISDVWFYPTAFTETYCIAALEAQAAGLLCVCTDVAALKEIVADRGVLISGSGNDPAVQQQLLDGLFATLSNPQLKNSYQEKARKWAATQGFDELAEEWESNLFCL